MDGSMYSKWITIEYLILILYYHFIEFCTQTKFGASKEKVNWLFKPEQGILSFPWSAEEEKEEEHNFFGSLLILTSVVDRLHFPWRISLLADGFLNVC
jgi:hypothetical protein